ncbi:hypothetical protein J2S00_000244 [Caldalkalibacillus uzonensis]|uniref:Uncharacterized protein n=1 Tax=Caldalkalibacillus uzonensis TaxID=353224 RepID=A0ABU0CNK7_9BACI|nr:hypothetical protein [Caldalkalibacillus uzonensis]MDQ0337474.1 hypothetical protein [Caldalkalibacillus uzonensis]
MVKKKLKRFNRQPAGKFQHTMKIVTSDKCETCRQCERGLAYLEKMSQPGAIGYGVPCILTKGKAFK